MSSISVFRWSGLAAILSGLLLPVPWIMEIIFELPPSTLSMSVDFLAITFIVFALTGIYGFQIEEAGVYGFLGFVLTVIMSCIGLSGINWSPESIQASEGLDLLTLLLAITGLAGYILLGIGTWKAGKFSRWVAVLWPLGTIISAGGVAVEILHVVGMVLWGLGMIGAGVKLLSVTVEPGMEPVAAT